jgi:D-glycero-D-manno-heptose 1,7-bisphosphate phosphatase
MSGRAIFLDRDGVLVRDVGPLTSRADIVLTPGVAPALAELARANFRLIVVSNQTVVARGLLDEGAMIELQREIEARIRAEGGPAIDAFYFCPHHPKATRPELRTDCTCRKPAPGLLLRAAAEHDISLADSFMIGDRASDVVAGLRAGCTTVQLTSGAHLAPAIEVTGGFEARAAHHVAATLVEASLFVVGRTTQKTDSSLGAAS